MTKPNVLKQFSLKYYNDILLYILLPSAPILLLSSFGFSIFAVIINFIYSITLYPIYEFLGVYWGSNCFYFLSDALYRVFMITAPIYFAFYLLWDIKRKNINLNFNPYKSNFNSSTRLSNKLPRLKVALHLRFTYNCFIQIIKSHLKKAALGIILPMLLFTLGGDNKYQDVYRVFTDTDARVSRGINFGGYSLKELINKELEAIYYNKDVHPKLKEKFGDLNEYISIEELRDLKLPLIHGLTTTK